MSKKLTGHGIQAIPENQKDAWMCGFGRCKQKAVALAIREYEVSGKLEYTTSGACYRCAKRWQKKCQGCLNVLEKIVNKPEVHAKWSKS